MAIDISTPPDLSKPPDAASAGWWMQRLAARLADQTRSKRLDLLDAWYRGKPPLPPGARGSEQAYVAFQEFARSNLASLLVKAPLHRMQPTGIRTSADGDDAGDARAWQVWRRAGLPLTSAEVHRTFLRLGECPTIVGPVSAKTGVSTITAEDPRQMVVECDPMDGTELAALKVYRDEIAGLDLAYLYRPGRIDVASRPVKNPNRSGQSRVSSAFSATTFTMDPALSPEVPPDLMPVILFRNIDGEAEFEPHLDLLGRINHGILMRLQIAVMQAFRQRFTEGGLPSRDDQGNPIRWSDVFSPDAGAFWSLPAGVVLKELGQVDLTPILSAVADDLKHLSAASETPMHMLDPANANQSAAGAVLSREGLVFRVEDRIARATASWDRVMHVAFLWLGDTERADLLGIDVIWAPPERASLAERTASAAQAHAGGVPWETVMTDVMQYSPDKVSRLRTQRDDDLLFAQQLAAIKAPPPSPLQPAGDTSPDAVTQPASEPEPANA